MRSQDWATLHERLHERIRTFIDGNEDQVRQLLSDCLQSELHNEIDQGMVVGFLTDNGCPPRSAAGGGASITDRVVGTSQAFVDGTTQKFINDAFLTRAAPDQIAALLDRRDPPGAALVTGEEGSGKSAVIAELVRARRLGGQMVLTVDVQTLSHEPDTAAVGAQLGLPVAPAAALAMCSPDRPAVLVLDAVDAVGTNRGRPIELYGVVDRLIKEALAYPNVTLVMSCRQEELDSDDRLRSLVHEHSRTETVEVPRLDADQVRTAVVDARGDPDVLTEDQVSLLRLPEMLRLYVRTMEAGPPTFTNKQELIDRYLAWIDRQVK